MKWFKHTKIWLIVAIVIFGLAGVCGGLYGEKLLQDNDDKAGKKIKETQQVKVEPSIDEQVEAILKSMSMREKVGQMVMIGIKGTEVNDDSRNMLKEYHIGGVVLFDRNLQSDEQVSRLNSDLQAQANEKLPLFIAIDEEGGRVVRMKDILTPPPSQQAIGESGDLVKAREWAVYTAQELKKLGFNLNFAPVADVGSGDSRYYSKKPEVVANFVNSAALGYEQEKMLYTLKHFPGIGKGRVDTHIDAYSVRVNKRTLLNEDVIPFKAMLQQHQHENYLMMVSHLTYTAFDKQHPASLSKAIVNDLLRNELQYKGIIITDDMEMGAVSKHYDFSEVGAKAVMAGVDIILVCHEYEHEAAVYNSILKAVENGKISEERIDESLRRIIKAKLLHLK